MKKIKDIFYTFVCVTTCVVFATALYTSIFWPGVALDSSILWKILMVSFLCSLGILVYPEREVGKHLMLCIILLHYVWVNIVVLGCGLWFEWFLSDNLWQVLGMVLLIAVIFAIVSLVCWKRGKQMAALMNTKLKEYQNGREND